MIDIQVGSTLTNGISAGRAERRVTSDAQGGVAGWVLLNISLEPFGGNTGMTSFVPDYLLASWRHVPFEWAPCLPHFPQLEERFVWAPGWRWLQREYRAVGDE